VDSKPDLMRIKPSGRQRWFTGLGNPEIKNLISLLYRPLPCILFSITIKEKYDANNP
jgi:hypothetical protein